MSSGLTTTTRRTCGSRIPAISHAAPVTSNATRSSRPRLWANSSSASGELSIRPAERTTPASQIAISQKSRCTSNPIALLTTTSSRRRTGENERANDNDRYVLAAQPGQLAGAANRIFSRSKRIVQLGLPGAFSQKAPVPGHPTVRSAPDGNSPSRIFMPRI